MKALRLLLLVVATGAILSITTANSDDWPCWRGPNLDGVSAETGLLKEWPEGGPTQLWSIDLAGGFSSVVTSGGKLFAQTREGKQEVVVCIDPATGHDIWRYRYDCDYSKYPTFTGGPRPATRTGPRSTPAVNAGRVYTLGATGILLCLDAKTGIKIWEQDLLKIGERECPAHGYCDSPLVVGDLIFVQPGGANGKSVAALNKSDGSVLWQALDDVQGCSSPTFAQVNGVPQVIFFTGIAAVGLDPADGKLLWRYPWKTQYDLSIATPIVSGDKVFISSNYGTGGAVFHVTDKPDPETVWKDKTMENHFSTSVLIGDYLYGFSRDQLACVDFRTGASKWDHAGLGKGSLVAADGNLIVLGEQGNLVFAKASPDGYTEISHCKLFGGKALTWTVPTLSDGRLFVRSENTLIALDLRAK